MRKSVFAMTIVLVCMIAAAAFAGSSLDQAASPTSAGGGAMYTLENIYQRLLNGTAATKRVGPFAEPGAGPASTGHTLDDIYNLIAPPAAVPKTGDSADGATGVSFPNPRFTVNAGCTVTDNLTGRMWLKDANLAATVSYNPDSTGDGSVQWSNAAALVAALNAGTAPFNAGKNCGYTDRRLPTLRELQSLIHYGYFNPALSDTVGTGQWTPGNPFDNVQANVYWSATTYSGLTALAWFVSLYDGRVDVVNKTVTFYVWPVR